MSEVSDLTSTRKGWNVYYLEWTDSTAAAYYVWKDAELVLTTTETHAEISVDYNTFPVISVFDSSTDQPVYAQSGFTTLSWYADSTTKKFKVEKMDGTSWEFVQYIDNPGKTYFEYRTPYLDDEQTHQYRVTPIATSGESGEARTFDVVMARYPDIPNYTLAETFDSTSGESLGWEITLNE